MPLWLRPALTVAVALSPVLIRSLRASMLGVLGAEFITTARAKGVPAPRLLVRHVLRNAIIPAVTVLGINIGYLIGGTLIVEQVFAIPGLGSLISGFHGMLELLQMLGPELGEEVPQRGEPFGRHRQVIQSRKSCERAGPDPRVEAAAPENREEHRQYSVVSSQVCGSTVSPSAFQATLWLGLGVP